MSTLFQVIKDTTMENNGLKHLIRSLEPRYEMSVGTMLIC